MFQEFSYTPDTMPTSVNPAEMVGLDTQFPEFHNRIRFDTDTRKGSVLDVIHVMTGMKSNDCAKTVKRLGETYPELVERFQKTRINGKVKKFVNSVKVSILWIPHIWGLVYEVWGKLVLLGKQPHLIISLGTTYTSCSYKGPKKTCFRHPWISSTVVSLMFHWIYRFYRKTILGE